MNLLLFVVRFILKAIMLALLYFYQFFLSPLKTVLFGGHARCRFYPSCSDYAVKCVRVHSPAHAIWLIIKRLMKCHPFHSGGVDDLTTDC